MAWALGAFQAQADIRALMQPAPQGLGRTLLPFSVPSVSRSRERPGLCRGRFRCEVRDRGCPPCGCGNGHLLKGTGPVVRPLKRRGFLHVRCSPGRSQWVNSLLLLPPKEQGGNSVKRASEGIKLNPRPSKQGTCVWEAEQLGRHQFPARLVSFL